MFRAKLRRRRSTSPRATRVMIERLKSHQVGLFRTFLERMEVGLRRRLIAGRHHRISGRQSGATAGRNRLRPADHFRRVPHGADRRPGSTWRSSRRRQRQSSCAPFPPTMRSSPPFRPPTRSASQSCRHRWQLPVTTTGAAGTVADELVRRADRDGHRRHPSGLLPGRHHGPNRPRLRGTKALRYNDGNLARLDRSNTTLVRTAAALRPNSPQRVLPAQHGHHCRCSVGFHAGQPDDGNMPKPRWQQVPGGQGQGLRCIPHAAARPFRCWTRRLTCSTVAQRGPARARAAGASPGQPDLLRMAKDAAGRVSGHRHRDDTRQLLRSGGLSAERFAELQLGTNFSTTDPWMKCDGWSRKHLPGPVSDRQSR